MFALICLRCFVEQYQIGILLMFNFREQNNKKFYLRLHSSLMVVLTHIEQTMPKAWFCTYYGLMKKQWDL